MEKRVLFLQNTEEVIHAISSLLDSNEGERIYVCGPADKAILDHIFDFLDQNEKNVEVRVILPALVRGDYLKGSLLYQINQLAGRTRLTGKALHNIIASPKGSLLISSSSLKDQNRLCGVLIREDEENRKVQAYCQKLWDNSLPLRLE
ncbi:MAG: hypothetical protein ACOX6S_13565 [Clostridia bacterium]|jgi:hypothetical protein